MLSMGRDTVNPGSNARRAELWEESQGIYLFIPAQSNFS